MASHEQALQDPNVPQQVKRFLQRHIQETLQLQQSMQMAQAMGQGPSGGAPPVGPQAQNAAIGAQPQAGGGTSPQAGMPMMSGNGAPQR